MTFWRVSALVLVLTLLAFAFVFVGAQILVAFLTGSVIAATGGVYLLLFLMDEAAQPTTRPLSARSSSEHARAGHHSESAWFGVVLQRWFDEQALSRVLAARYQARLTRLFEKAATQSAAFAGRVESVECTDLSIGTGCPTLSRFLPSTAVDGAARISFDIDYSDGGAQFAVCMMLKLELPLRTEPVRIAVRLAVQATTVHGRMALVIPTGSHPLLRLAFVSEPTCTFAVSSQVGGTLRLANLKRLREFVVSKLEAQIRKHLVEPSGLGFNIPVKGAIKMHVRPLTPAPKADDVESDDDSDALAAELDNIAKED